MIRALIVLLALLAVSVRDAPKVGYEVVDAGTPNQAPELELERNRTLVRLLKERFSDGTFLGFCDGVYAEERLQLPAAIRLQVPPSEHGILAAFYRCADSYEKNYLAFVLLGEGENPFALREWRESDRLRVVDCGWDMLKREAAIEAWLHHYAEAGAVFAMRSLKLLSNPEPVPESLSGRG